MNLKIKKVVIVKLLVESLGKFLSVMRDLVTKTYPQFLTFRSTFKISKKILKCKKNWKVHLDFE